MHGDRDPQDTPYSSARQAYAELPPTKAFLTFLGGDHGNYWGGTVAVRTFLDWMRWSLYGDLAARGRLPWRRDVLEHQVGVHPGRGCAGRAAVRGGELAGGM